MLQSILVRDGYAFIMTGVAQKKDFTKFQEEFLAMFRSLTVTEDLYASIEDPTKKALLIDQMTQLKEDCLPHVINAFSKPNLNEDDKFVMLSYLFSEKSFYKKYLLPFEQFLDKYYSREGLYWQMHVIHQLQDEIIHNPLIKNN